MGPCRRIHNYIGRGTVAKRRPLRVTEIANRHSIPDRYLEQMLAMLRRGHLLSSLRGPRGGYRLTRSPAEITVAEVLACPYEQIASKSPLERKHR